MNASYAIIILLKPCVEHTTCGLCDFRNMTFEQLEALIEAGTRYLERMKNTTAAEL